MVIRYKAFIINVHVKIKNNINLITYTYILYFISYILHTHTRTHARTHCICIYFI